MRYLSCVLATCLLCAGSALAGLAGPTLNIVASATNGIALLANANSTDTVALFANGNSAARYSRVSAPEVRRSSRSMQMARSTRTVRSIRMASIIRTSFPLSAVCNRAMSWSSAMTV